MASSDSTTYAIYRIVCFRTGKVYVGQTINPKIRRTKHFCDLKRQVHHNSYLQNAYNKYGAEAFYFEVLEKSIEKADIVQREQYWIDHFNSYKDGFNLTPGGDLAPNNGKPCVWNGVEYPSIVDAAKQNNITPAALYIRLSRGIKDASEMIGSQGNNKKLCTWNGVSYKTIREAAHANGITRIAMHYRLLAGYTCDKDMPGHAFNNAKSCVWNGVSYKSAAEAARILGIKQVTLRWRLRNGYTCDADLKRK